MQSKVLKTKDLARYLHVHHSTIYRLLARGDGPRAWKIGGDYRWNIETVDEWLRTRPQGQVESRS